jgi:ribosome maturation factor RimP
MRLPGCLSEIFCILRKIVYFCTEFKKANYRGQVVPYYYLNMISTAQIKNWVQDIITADNFYVVEVSVSASNHIIIFIDSMKGVTIDDCARVSRAVEQQLDRDKEDFELEVSSPGITEPFKVPQQYQKNIGKEVEVLLKNGVKHKGRLLSFEENILLLETQKKVKPEWKKKPEQITEQFKFEINEIKFTKLILNF